MRSPKYLIPSFLLSPQYKRVFSDLQSRHSEGLLNAQEIKKLNELMQVYRHGLVRKAKAMQVAMMRGLIPALNRAYS